MIILKHGVVAILMLTGTFFAPAASAQQVEADLSADEVKLIRGIYARDQFIRDMSKGVELLSKLNTLASLATPPSPAKLVLQWNSGLLKGWRTANGNLAKIGQATACTELVVAADSSVGAKDFFEKLAEARGCNDL
jgi:hypothetical protein